MEVELQNFPTWLPPLSIMLLLFLGNGGYGTLIWVSQTKPPYLVASFLNYAASLPWQWWIWNPNLGKPSKSDHVVSTALYHAASLPWQQWILNTNLVSQTKPPHVAASSLNNAASLLCNGGYRTISG